MVRSESIAFAVIASFAAVILAGCGSGGAPPAASGDSPAAEFKVQEYVGDGGGSLKPWPVLIPLSGTDQAARQGYPLKFDVAPRADRVPKKQISWYKLDNLTSNQTCLVCIQPTADEDADLYVMDGNGSGYGDGAGCIAHSVRAPTSGTDHVTGYAPDWVVFDSGPTRGWPTAQVAVYGVNANPRLKHYRIEAEDVWHLTVNPSGSSGGNIEQYDSHWWQFDATSGTAYTVALTASSGDPDLYVYQDEATEFVGSDISIGGGTVSFTATDTVRHIVRVYAFGSAAHYSLEVTSP